MLELATPHDGHAGRAGCDANVLLAPVHDEHCADDADRGCADERDARYEQRALEPLLDATRFGVLVLRARVVELAPAIALYDRVAERHRGHRGQPQRRAGPYRPPRVPRRAR